MHACMCTHMQPAVRPEEPEEEQNRQRHRCRPPCPLPGVDAQAAPSPHALPPECRSTGEMGCCVSAGPPPVSASPADFAAWASSNATTAVGVDVAVANATNGVAVADATAVVGVPGAVSTAPAV